MFLSMALIFAAVLQSANAYERVGCFTDDLNNRRLLGPMVLLYKVNSPRFCAATCLEAGYELAGVEFGKECFCGNKYDFDGLHKILDSKKHCQMACTDRTTTETCGGKFELDVYTTGHQVDISKRGELLGAYKDWSPLGFTRLLKGKHYKFSNNTPKVCVDVCSNKGFELAGVEDINDCFCGSHTEFEKRIADEMKWNRFKCSGDSGQVCGANGLIVVYSTGFGDWCLLPVSINDTDANKFIQTILHNVLPFDISQFKVFVSKPIIEEKNNKLKVRCARGTPSYYTGPLPWPGLINDQGGFDAMRKFKNSIKNIKCMEGKWFGFDETSGIVNQVIGVACLNTA